MTARIPAAMLVLVVLAVFVAPVLMPAAAEAQCAMCRTAFDSPEGREMVRNYQIGILFLLAVPFVAVATVGYFAVRGKRRLDEESQVR